MKGVVFTEFVDFVEANFSVETVDHLLDTADLPSGGVYTAVGTYSSGELVTLARNLAAHVDRPLSELLHGFGQHLFRTFTVAFPQFFVGANSGMDFLERVDGYVHLEVRKLYPDAELPSFQCERRDGAFVMTYRSALNLPDLAAGLIDGCLAHFGENLKVRRETVPAEPQATRFVLTAA